MGIKCPKCKSNNTEATAPKKMFCKNCSHQWTPYKHRGAKMKVVGDGIIYPKRKIIPKAKTKVVGDGILTPKRRVKKNKGVKEKPIWEQII